MLINQCFKPLECERFITLRRDGAQAEISSFSQYRQQAGVAATVQWVVLKAAVQRKKTFNYSSKETELGQFYRRQVESKGPFKRSW